MPLRVRCRCEPILSRCRHPAVILANTCIGVRANSEKGQRGKTGLVVQTIGRWNVEKCTPRHEVCFSLQLDMCPRYRHLDHTPILRVVPVFSTTDDF
jgi:hypothetical protein